MEIVRGVFHIAGATLILLAGVGVLRFPDLYSRMHAATKAATLGFLLVAFGTFTDLDSNAAKLVLATGLIFMTAPVAAHLLGRSAYRADRVEMAIDSRDDLEDIVAEERRTSD